MKTLSALLSVLALGAGLSQAAMAAERSGVILGAGLNGATLSPRRSGGNQSGLGMELSARYDFGSRWMAFAKTSGASLDDATGTSYTLGHLDLLAHYRFRTDTRRFHPHLEGGFSRRTAHYTSTAEDEVTTRRQAGWGPTFGAGVSYALTPSFAFNASLHHTLGEFSSEQCSSRGDSVRTCATSTRLSVGFNWYPGRR